MKFLHDRVIDTSIIYRSSSDTTCSLRELAVALLGSDQENPHDSISDAQIAYKCAEYALTAVGPLPAVGKFSLKMRKQLKSDMFRKMHGGGQAEKRKRVVKYGGCDPKVSLLVHRLPPGTKSETVPYFYSSSNYTAFSHLIRLT
jgi:hypothetical protein